MPGQTDHGEGLRQAARVNDYVKLKELIEQGAEVNSNNVCGTCKHPSVDRCLSGSTAVCPCA